VFKLELEKKTCSLAKPDSLGEGIMQVPTEKRRVASVPGSILHERRAHEKKALSVLRRSNRGGAVLRRGKSPCFATGGDSARGLHRRVNLATQEKSRENIKYWGIS